MLIAKVTFPIKQSKSFDQKKYIGMIEDYLSALSLNGQIWGEYQLGMMNGVPESYVTVPEKNSIMPRYTSSHGKSLRNKLKEQCGIYPIWSFLTDDEELPWKNWNKSAFLFLSTNFLDNSSPVAMPHKDSGTSVPLYLIPVEDDVREYISRWSYSYQAHDQLWIGSGALEMMAYEQIASVESDLSAEGREHCKAIEDATGIPTYFYQYRYFGYSTGEKDRVCPACGSEWRHSNISDKSFSEFHFLCEPCRIVSHEGDSEEDGDELARIGDFNESKS